MNSHETPASGVARSSFLSQLINTHVEGNSSSVGGTGAFRTITLVVTMIVAGIVSAQRITPAESSVGTASWMQYLVPNYALELHDLPEDTLLTVRAVHLNEIIAEETYSAASETGVVIEVAAFLVDGYILPCANTPALFIGVRTIGPPERDSRSLRCLAHQPRSVIPIRLGLNEYADRDFPMNTWVPVLALEALPVNPPVQHPRDMIVFYLIIADTDSLPPLPKPANPFDARQLVRDSLD